MKVVKYQNVEEMLGQLNAQDKGRYFLCACPECQQPEAFIYKNNLRKITCNRDNKCGATTHVVFSEVAKGVDFQLSQEPQYESLTKEQREDLRYVSQFVRHMQHNVVSELDNGYRGLSRNVTEQFVADLSSTNAKGELATTLFFEKAKSLLNKDYTKNDWMLKRNLVIPIYDEHNMIERVLLRSSIAPNMQPKEIQLVLNPSKETKDFFVALNGKSKVVVITEALFDGMSFKEVHPEINYLALTGVNRTRKLLNYLKDNREYFADKHFVVAMDNDIAGERASNHIIQTLMQENIGANHQVFSYPEGINDPNEFLQQDRMVFKRSLSFALRQHHRAKEAMYG